MINRDRLASLLQSAGANVPSDQPETLGRPGPWRDNYATAPVGRPITTQDLQRMQDEYFRARDEEASRQFYGGQQREIMRGEAMRNDVNAPPVQNQELPPELRWAGFEELTPLPYVYRATQGATRMALGRDDADPLGTAGNALQAGLFFLPGMRGERAVARDVRPPLIADDLPVRGDVRTGGFAVDGPYLPTNERGHPIATEQYPFGFRQNPRESTAVQTDQFYPTTGNAAPFYDRSVFQEETLPTDSLIGTQSDIRDNFLNPARAGDVGEPISVVRTPEGQNYIINGHHRTAAAVAQAEPSIRARVYQGSLEPPARNAEPVQSSGTGDARNRLATLRAEGFDVDTPLYHGSGSYPLEGALRASDDGNLGPGVYVTNSPEGAGNFGARNTQGEGGQVAPVYARGPFATASQMRELRRTHGRDEAVRILQAQGYRGVRGRLKGDRYEYSIFDPRDVRYRFGDPQASPDASHAGSFTTARGSTYEVHADGTTTRNKAARSDPGHEGQRGPQPRSARTIYVTNDVANALATPQGSWRVYINGDKVSLLTPGQGGRWGISPSQRDLPFEAQPREGLTPIEVWNPDDGARGAFRRVHFGNEITEVRRAPQASDGNAFRELGRAEENPRSTLTAGINPSRPRGFAPGSAEERTRRNTRIMELYREMQPVPNKSTGAANPQARLGIRLDNSFPAIAERLRAEGYGDVTASSIRGVIKRARDAHATGAVSQAVENNQYADTARRLGLSEDRVKALSAQRPQINAGFDASTAMPWLATGGYFAALNAILNAAKNSGALDVPPFDPPLGSNQALNYNPVAQGSR